MKFVNKNDFDESNHAIEAKEVLEERRKPTAPIILDVRSKDDYDGNHLVGAHSLPPELLKTTFKQIPLYAKIILYGDAEDAKTAESAKLLVDNRFNDVSFVKGGLDNIMAALESSPDEIVLANIPEEEWGAKIEDVLTEKVRPTLASDGGGLTVAKIDGAKVYINYQGACSGCASAATGTLNYIRHTLSTALNHDIEVIMA